MLVTIARHDMTQANEIFNTMTDDEIALCYLTCYDIDILSGEDINEMSDELSQNTAVSKACRELIKKCSEGFCSLIVKCPICGGIMLPANDDNGKLFLECHGSGGVECHLHLQEDDTDEKEPSFMPLFEKALNFNTKAVRTGIISISCPSCGNEINVTDDHNDHVYCGTCGSRYPMRIVSFVK